MLVYLEKSVPLYFDSYGFVALFKEIEQFLESLNSGVYRYSVQQLQLNTSSVCGHYMTYFAAQLCCRFKFKDIRTVFRRVTSKPKISY